MKSLLLVDVSNLYYCLSKQFEAKLDYAKLLEYLAEKGYDVAHKIAYATHSDYQNVFLKTLNDIGFLVKTKERTNAGANVDSEIVFDAVAMHKHFDCVIFATGDGDFAPCVEMIRDRVKTVIIGSNISSKLKRYAHEAHEITGELFYTRSGVEING